MGNTLSRLYTAVMDTFLLDYDTKYEGQAKK